MFLPTTRQELDQLGWNALDVILVTGDSYIDSPYIGIAVIGKVLVNAGYRVGIIAQPDVQSNQDITRLGEPLLFWGVTGGSVDSMVSNYTALKKKRHNDDYTPGGINNRRPDRAVITYVNLIRRFYKRTRPIVLGGIEASLRRIAHYDFWSDRIRGSILFDAKADYLLYGMAERSVLELALAIENNTAVEQTRGLCYIARQKREEYLELPSLAEVTGDKLAFINMYHTFYRNNDPLNAKGLCQQHGDRFLIQNPPAIYPDQSEIDAVYDMVYEYDQHPYYAQLGKVRALETIKFSISTHRGCYGECNFCAIAVHEGRTVRWRSEASILAEARHLTELPDFKGYILDAGGPTANMYAIECDIKLKSGSCQGKRCLTPNICPVLKIDHKPQTELLRRLRKIKGVTKVFIASGIRYDLLLADRKSGQEYLEEIVEHHVSGQLKIAPEHSETHILRRMGKPGRTPLLKFKERFDSLSHSSGKKQFLTYYLIAAYPDCTDDDMRKLKEFANQSLQINPEQIQVFTPTPSTYASVMYYTEMDPFTHEKIFVEKDPIKKQRQKDIVLQKNKKNNLKVR